MLVSEWNYACEKCKENISNKNIKFIFCGMLCFAQLTINNTRNLYLLKNWKRNIYELKMYKKQNSLT